MLARPWGLCGRTGRTAGLTGHQPSELWAGEELPVMVVCTEAWQGNSEEECVCQREYKDGGTEANTLNSFLSLTEMRLSGPKLSEGIV